MKRMLRLVCVGLAGLGVATSLLWWNTNKNHDGLLVAGSIVIEGPFENGLFSPNELKVDRLTERCPVNFNVGFEEEHGYCFITLTFALKKDGPPPRDITIVCAVIGKNGKVLGREYRAFSAHPAPPLPTINGYTSFNWPGREILFELDDSMIRDIGRLEITVS
jgi:hypothetical protein